MRPAEVFFNPMDPQVLAEVNYHKQAETKSDPGFKAIKIGTSRVEFVPNLSSKSSIKRVIGKILRR